MGPIFVHKAVKFLSFKNTFLFKRGIWLSAGALIACVATPVIFDANLRRNPFPNLFGVCALGIFLAYLIWNARIHRLVDEVVDCDDHLKIRRGRTEEVIRFSNIAAADVSVGAGIHRITLRLREPTKLGRQIEFLPQASLWSSPSGVERLASSLTERANRSAAGPMPLA
jgi:hypothetical protein